MTSGNLRETLPPPRRPENQSGHIHWEDEEESVQLQYRLNDEAQLNEQSPFICSLFVELHTFEYHKYFLTVMKRDEEECFRLDKMTNNWSVNGLTCRD